MLGVRAIVLGPPHLEPNKLVVVDVEEFVVRVFKGGKVTVPKRLRSCGGLRMGLCSFGFDDVMKREEVAG